MDRKDLTVINLSALLISIFVVLFFCKIAGLGMGVDMHWAVVLSPLWFPIVFVIILYGLHKIFKRKK